MKKTILFLLTCLVFVCSCKKDNDNRPTSESGKLSVSVGVEVFTGKINTSWKSTLDTEDFKVLICKNTGEVVKTFERAADMPDEITLETGEYYVTAHSNNFLPAAFENPYYFGKSENFNLSKEEHRTVTVNCELANCAVSVTYSGNIQSDFTDYYATVSISDSALKYEKDEARTGYFDLKPISIEALLVYSMVNGSSQTKLLTGIIEDPQAKKHYEVRLDASVNDGIASVNIYLDDSTDYELVEISEGDTNGIPGNIIYGALLITEIMYDPTAISDAEGEWFEIYNNSSSQIDINGIVIRRVGDLHVINQEKVLLPGEYYVLARSENATSAPKYIYGTDITLTNSGAELIIANYGTDGTDGFEIASVNYGAKGFPHPSGASLNLDPVYYNVESAKLGTNWCASTDVYDTGDLGTPGSVNSSCD